MPALGLSVPKKDIDRIFDEWDKGGEQKRAFRIYFDELAALNIPGRPGVAQILAGYTYAHANDYCESVQH